MLKSYSNKNLQNASFVGKDLTGESFASSDLRGADFSDSILTGADFSNVKTGLTPWSTTWILGAALIISCFSGYVAMLAGHLVQQMLNSTDPNVKFAGYLVLMAYLLFIAVSWWSGLKNASRNLLIPLALLATIIGVAARISGMGTGEGMLYMILCLFLIAMMFAVGTLARASAGTISNILFAVVAVSGGVFGRSVGGGIGTVVLAISCALISKKALSGAPGFDLLTRITSLITSRLGTAFRNAKLDHAHFSGAALRNADFTDASLLSVEWGNVKKISCLFNWPTTFRRNTRSEKKLDTAI